MSWSDLMLTPNPEWLPRRPIIGGKYATFDGRYFEVTRGAWFGYHIDRIDSNGFYLGETCWVEKYKDVKPTIRHWLNRPGSIPAEYEVEDIFGTEDGTPTAVARERAGHVRMSA